MNAVTARSRISTSTSFRVGFQIAVPLLVAGMIFRVGMGVLSRLIPQIQVFFVHSKITHRVGG